MLATCKHQGSVMKHRIEIVITLEEDTTLEQAQLVREIILQAIRYELKTLSQGNAPVGSILDGET